MEMTTQLDAADVALEQEKFSLDDSALTDPNTITSRNAGSNAGATPVESAPAEPTLAEPITVALSRDELLVVLDALGVDSIPGIDIEPTGDWSAREQEIAKTVATRSLRARELVQPGPDGELTIHTDLLTAVGACAHSQSAAFVFHWPTRAGAPMRYFGHLCGDDFVFHARPDDVLHLFTLMPTKALLVEQILAICGLAEEQEAAIHEFRIPAERFAEIRTASTVDEASALLIAQGVLPPSAQAFAQTLAHSSTQENSENPSRISILQAIQQTDADTVMKRDFTILDDTEHRWLVAAESETDEALPLLIKTTTRDELLGLLFQWV